MTISDTGQQDMTSQPAITFYGKMLTFSRLQLSTDDLTAIEAHLAGMLSNKTSHIPVLIDSSIEQDLPALIELLWSWGLQPIGVVNGLLDKQARAQRMAIFPADGKRIERIVSSKKSVTQLSQTTSETAESQAEKNNSTDDTAAQTDTSIIDVPAETLLSSDHITSMIYDQLLRSGQTINHVGGDLILTNSVNSGAEAITDNSLHVYGRAQGRLVAGATGDKDARIFCQVFNPSLVSVAGTYCLRDNLPENTIDKPVQVRFVEGEGLVFTVMENI
ncbi:septum site-determining protein MinC [Psychrobacter sp. P2G3]|uniref:septum site-determining protein MinC n=1 Tax=Psychrobacter sp. P2G3 TaxID=1699622 RepID=UPI00078CE0E8|nr:septum site-determining protein MinC [Psychrobacter sp. P2G3]AMN50420.1 septum site-determining protein MinC [Psychrobacter sp. P2G3]